MTLSPHFLGLPPTLDRLKKWPQRQCTCVVTWHDPSLEMNGWRLCVSCDRNVVDWLQALYAETRYTLIFLMWFGGHWPLHPRHGLPVFRTSFFPPFTHSKLNEKDLCCGWMNNEDNKYSDGLGDKSRCPSAKFNKVTRGWFRMRYLVHHSK